MKPPRISRPVLGTLAVCWGATLTQSPAQRQAMLHLGAEAHRQVSHMRIARLLGREVGDDGGTDLLASSSCPGEALFLQNPAFGNLCPTAVEALAHV